MLKRVLIGSGTLAALGGTFMLGSVMLGGAAAQTTLQPTQTPNTAACAQQDAQPDGVEPAGPDTDTADVQCGDQTGTDAAGADSAEKKSAGAADTDNVQEGDQTTADVSGGVSK